MSGADQIHTERSGRPLGLPTLLVSLASALAILATAVRLVAWRMDLHYVEPWYDGLPVEKHHLFYGSFIDRQLLWTGLPLIATNVMTLAVLWASIRGRNRSA